MAHPLVEAVAAAAANSDATVIVCPPATLLMQVTGWLVGSKVKDSTGRDTILAREIVADNVTYRFRDANGKPIW